MRNWGRCIALGAVVLAASGRHQSSCPYYLAVFEADPHEGVGCDQEFRSSELCAAGSTGIE